MISLAYALMNLAVLYWIIYPWGGRWLFTGLAFATGLVLVWIRDSLTVVHSLMSRIGIAIGVAAWIFFLYQSVHNELPRRQPGFFFTQDPRNWFARTN